MSDMMKMFVEQELQNQIKRTIHTCSIRPALCKGGICGRQNGEAV